MVLSVPLMIVNLMVAWLWLQLLYLPLPCCSRKSKDDGEEALSSDNITRLLRSRYDDLGPLTRHEKSVSAMFFILVLLWMTRSPGFVSGWEELFPRGVADATPAMLIALVMFAVPVSEERILEIGWH